MTSLNRMGLLVAAAAAIATVPTAVLAEIVIFDFSGTYDSGSRAGQAFSGRVQYDRGAPAIAAFPTFASYGSLQITNAVNFTTPSQIGIFVGDRPSGSTSPDFVIFSNGGGNGFSLGFGGDPSLLSSPALPTFAQLAQMTALPTFQFNDSLSSGPIVISEVIPSVPEPASWAMMLAGFGGVGLTMRRRHGARMRLA